MGRMFLIFYNSLFYYAPTKSCTHLDSIFTEMVRQLVVKMLHEMCLHLSLYDGLGLRK